MIHNYRLCAGLLLFIISIFRYIREVRSITIRGMKSARSRVKRVHAFCVCSVHRVDRSYRRDITFYSYDFLNQEKIYCIYVVIRRCTMVVIFIFIFMFASFSLRVYSYRPCHFNVIALLHAAVCSNHICWYSGDGIYLSILYRDMCAVCMELRLMIARIKATTIPFDQWREKSWHVNENRRKEKR